MTVLAILLYIGGGLVIAFAFVDSGRWGQALCGAFYVVLARALQLGIRWARIVLLTLCWIGLAIAAVGALLSGPRAAVEQAVWPLLYLVLAGRPSVREWFTSNG